MNINKVQDVRFKNLNSGTCFYLGVPYEFEVKEKDGVIEVVTHTEDEHTNEVKKQIEERFISNVKNQLLNKVSETEEFFKMLRTFAYKKGFMQKDVDQVLVKIYKIIKKLKEV